MTTLATNALTTVADVKESLGIASSDTTKDNLITRKINQASQQIENYCERVFRVDDYIETLMGSETDQLTLKQRPINSVTTLEGRSSALNTENYQSINSSYYFIDSTAGLLDLLYTARGRWSRWRVTYNAGYATIPSDLAEACADLACYYVQNADGNVNIKAKQEGQRKIDYWQGITGFRNLIQQLGIEQVIDGYANWPLRSE